MPLLPITLTLPEESLAVVVGGGPVGERKSRAFLAAGLRVRIIAPAVTPGLEALAQSGAVEWLARTYAPGDLAEARLVCAATDVRAVNRAVAEEAYRRGLLVNVADRPDDGNFHMPAVHRADGVIIAVSSEAARPRLAQAVRDWVARIYQPPQPDLPGRGD